MVDTHELAWLAGFWDGEGCVSNHAKYATPLFTLGQAGGEGRELCERVLRAAGVDRGGVHGGYMNAGRRSPYYMVRITGGKRVAELLEKCRPWLSRTKIEQAERVLANWHEYRRVNNVVTLADRTHCNNGHAFDEKNTYFPPAGARMQGRRCRRCAADKEARRRKARQLEASSERAACQEAK